MCVLLSRKQARKFGMLKVVRVDAVNLENAPPEHISMKIHAHVNRYDRFYFNYTTLWDGICTSSSEWLMFWCNLLVDSLLCNNFIFLYISKKLLKGVAFFSSQIIIWFKTLFFTFDLILFFFLYVFFSPIL